MGVTTDKFLTFGNSRRGQIIGWLLTIVFVVIFFIGVTMTSLGSSIQTVDGISVAAANIDTGTVTDNDGGNYSGYHLVINSLNTPITILPSPISTTAPVNITYGKGSDNYIKLSSTHIAAGDTIILTLIKAISYDDPANPTVGKSRYYISDPDPQVGVDIISFTISCANKTEKVYIRVVPSPDQVKVTPTLEQTIPVPGGVVDYSDPNNWKPADYLDMQYFSDRSPYQFDIYYRVILSFSIFGVPIYDTNKNADDFKHFDYTEINLDSNVPSSILLFQPDPDKGYIIACSGAYTTDTPVNYKISCLFNNEYFFTDSNFLINIKGWQQ